MVVMSIVIRTRAREDLGDIITFASFSLASCSDSPAAGLKLRIILASSTVMRWARVSWSALASLLEDAAAPPAAASGLARKLRPACLPASRKALPTIWLPVMRSLARSCGRDCQM